MKTRTLALTLAPDQLFWKAALVLFASVFIALAAQVAIPLPGTPVPVTGQTFAVLLVGAALGSRLGLSAVALYVIQGAAGLPVWSPGASVGLARLGGPTGGYIIGFLVAAFVVGLLAERGWDRRLWTAALAMLAGEVVIYAIGVPWLARFVPAERVLDAGLIPFIGGDLWKLVTAAVLLPVAWRFVPPR